MYIHHNSKGNVWPEAGKKLSKLPLRKTSGKIWLWNNVPHPCAVEKRLTLHCLNPCVEWFWGEVHKQERCRAPQKRPANIVLYDHRLERGKHFGTPPKVGLNKQNIRSVYDQLFLISTPQVPAYGARKGRPSLMGKTNIWPSNSTWNYWGHLPAPYPQTNILITEIFWHLPVL